MCSDGVSESSLPSLLYTFIGDQRYDTVAFMVQLSFAIIPHIV